MTMYGAPSSSAPTSMMRATCSLLSRTVLRASRSEAAECLGAPDRLGEEELERDGLIEL